MIANVYFFAVLLLNTLATIAFAKPAAISADALSIGIPVRDIRLIPADILRDFPDVNTTVTVKSNFRRIIPADILRDFPSETIISANGTAVEVKVIPTDLMDNYPVIEIIAN